MLAGIIIRPRATSSRTSSGASFLAVGNIRHFFRDQALAGVMHLGEIAVRVLGLALRDPFGARLGEAVSIAAIAQKCRLREPSTCTNLNWEFVKVDYTLWIAMQ